MRFAGRAAAEVSPFTIGVATTAFLAAGIFVATDVALTIGDAQSRLQRAAGRLAELSAQASSSRTIAALDTPIAPAGVEMTAWQRDQAVASAPMLATGDGQPIDTAFIGQDFFGGGAEDTSRLAYELRRSSMLSDVTQRGLTAFGLAFAATGLSYRRRRTSRPPSQVERQRYSDLIATIPFGVACWTGAGAMVVSNEQYRARLDIDERDALLGASYEESLKRLVHGGYMRLVSEENDNRVLELHRADGSCLLIDERPLPEGGFVTLVTDVTERRRTDHLLSSIREEQRQLARRYHEEKLRAEAASRSKTSFLAHLSHDIRTPLNHIIGFAELIRHQTYGPLGDARYLNYVETIKASGERLLASFATILDLAELESGQKPLRLEQFSADVLLETSANRFGAQAARAGLSLAIGGPCHATLYADRFCLERMIGNLVDNAIRFTPAGGRVTLAAYAATDGVVIEVSDTGIGMDEERLSTLSQPFVFGDAAFANENKGAGLGIAIARAIAELSGGRLAIDSRPSLGTTVAVSLPLHAASETRAA